MEKSINIKEMLCPVCEKYCFEPFTEDELEEGMKPEDEFCPVCGWNYDEKQINDHNLKTELNHKTINEYKQWFNKQIDINPNYNYIEYNKPKSMPHMCPVCGKYEFIQAISYDICPYCGWEDDGTEEEDEYHIGVNGMSCNDYKKEYKELIEQNPNYRWKK